MGQGIWDWIVSNSVLQGLAILFSIILGGVWAVQRTLRAVRFMRKYKKERLDVKLKIARISKLRRYYLASSDIHLFINMITKNVMAMAMSLCVVILVAIGLYGNDPGGWQMTERVGQIEISRTTRTLLALNGVLCLLIFLQSVFRIGGFLQIVMSVRERWRRRALGFSRRRT